MQAFKLRVSGSLSYHHCVLDMLSHIAFVNCLTRLNSNYLPAEAAVASVMGIGSTTCRLKLG
jgi:hypothetical protein